MDRIHGTAWPLGQTLAAYSRSASTVPACLKGDRKTIFIAASGANKAEGYLRTFEDN